MQRKAARGPEKSTAKRSSTPSISNPNTELVVVGLGRGKGLAFCSLVMVLD